jgi:capsular polysaccharide biosynthesis protein/MinD-like ATPase involved in chromosome partitioning or flagellar assembly
MDIRSYLRLLRRHWALVLLLAVLGASVGGAMAWLKTPVYAAKTQLVVSSANPGKDATDAYQGSLLAQQYAQSYTKLLNNSTVARRLIAQLQLPYSVDKLQDEISAVNPTETAIINVKVEDHSRQRAKAIAGAIGPLFADTVKSVQVSPPQPESGDPDTARTGDVTLSALDPAELVPGPVSPNKVLYVTLGGVLGLALGIGGAVLREMTNSRIRDEEDLPAVSGAPLVAVFPRDVRATAHPMSLLTERRSDGGLVFQRLAVNLGLGSSDAQPRMFAMMSPRGGKAPAAIAAGLAITLAKGGDRVVIVDADLRNAHLAEALGLSSVWSLADVLADRIPLHRALEQVREDLPLLALAGLPPGSDLSDAPLRHDRLAALCARLTDLADVVIFVSPPVLTDADAVVLARAVRHMVVVVQAKTTRGEEVTHSEQCLDAADATVLGVVLSGVRTRRHSVPSSVPGATAKSSARVTADRFAGRYAADAKPMHNVPREERLR